MSKTETVNIQNKIIETGSKPANQFQSNPLNHRKHPIKQRKAVEASLRSIGWIQGVIENKRTGHLIDGHERVWQALQQGEETPVPYVLVDLSEEEEHLALAVFDRITGMAEIDADMLEQLLGQVNTDEAALMELMEEMAEESNILPEKDNQADLIEIGFQHLSWNKKNGSSFLSVRSWNSNRKKDEIKYIKDRKYIEDKLFSDNIADEIFASIISIFGGNIFSCVTTPPRTSETEYHLATDVSKKIAAMLGVNFVKLFDNKNRIVKNFTAKREKQSINKTLLFDVVSDEDLLLLIDDIATTGQTITGATEALHQAGVCVVPIAWIYSKVSK